MPTSWLHGWLQTPAIYAVLAVAFIAPFVDLRRPFRLLHLDLLVLLLAGAWPMYAYVKGGIPLTTGSRLSVVGGLGYLVVRLLVVASRRPCDPGPLLPHLPVRLLVVAAIVLVALRIGYAATTELHPYDVGFASVAGADLLARGTTPYSDELTAKVPHGDTYGPLLYLAYVPFEQISPYEFRPVQALPQAALVAPIAFDLLTAAALFLLGTRLGGRAGRGKALGVALAYAWLTYPYTLFSMAHGLNDGLPALALALALVALTAPALGGALTAAATATKFFAAGLVPLLARGAGPWRRGYTGPFIAGFAVLTLVALVPVLPPGGVTEFYDRTLGFQRARTSPTTIWGTVPSLEWLQDIATIGALALAIVVAFVPRHRGVAQVLALAAAVVAAAQIALAHWFPTYLLWLAPAALPALLVTAGGQVRSGGRDPGGR